MRQTLQYLRNATLLLSVACIPSAEAAKSSACAGCHTVIYRQWQASAMARTSGKAGQPLLEKFTRATFSDPRGLTQYTVSPRFQLSFSQPGLDGVRSLDYFLGAGRTGRSYLSSIDGYLFESPASWYTSRAAWDLSPGYEALPEIELAREVGAACLNCHATGIREREGNPGAFADPPWSEPGVACERCHGSGDQHIQGRRAAIVNPAKLSGAARDAVCAQCHLPGAVEIARSGRSGPYQPGGLLSDAVAVFVLAGEDREATINGHFEQLSRSRCLKAGSGALWCGTCHKIHGPSDYLAQCRSCHSSSGQKACTALAASRAASRDNCVACHMPKRNAATVAHASVTDHTISRFPRRAAQTGVTAATQLTPYGEAAAGARETGLAYATFALRDNNRPWGLRAVELLKTALAGNANDSKVATTLAQLYDRMNREDDACELYATAIRLDPAATTPRVNLAACFAKQGRMDDAILLWTDVLKAAPQTESARLNLAVALFRTGRKNEAKANLTEALRFNPASRRARDLLAGMK